MILKISEVAKMLDCHPNTIKIWISKGHLKTFKTPGGHYRFRDDDIKEFKKKYKLGVDNETNVETA